MKISGKTRLALCTGLVGIGLLSGFIIRQNYFPVMLTPSHFIQAGHDVGNIAFSADGSTFMASENCEGGDVTLWSPTLKKLLSQSQDSADGMRLFPDGRRSLNEETSPKSQITRCTLRDTASGKIIRRTRENG